MIRRRTPTLHAPRDHANRGRWFQNLLNDACRRYTQERCAYIAEIPTPMQTRPGYRGKRSVVGTHMEAYFVRKATTDYLGFTREDTVDPDNPEGPYDLVSRGIAFDAKSTLGFEYGASVKPHQMEILSLVSDLGHIAGIMVGFLGTRGDPPSAVWVPWPSAARLARGKWSKKKLLEIPIAREIRWNGFFNFLPVILGQREPEGAHP